MTHQHNYVLRAVTNAALSGRLHVLPSHWRHWLGL